MWDWVPACGTTGVSWVPVLRTMKAAAAAAAGGSGPVAGSRAVAEDVAGSKGRGDGRSGGGLRVSEESMFASAEDASTSLSRKASDMSATGRWIHACLLAMVATGSHGGRALIRSTLVCRRARGGGEVGWYPVPAPSKTKGAGNYM